MRLYIGLVHYPVYNKHAERTASAITTVDLHDLGRLARTYGIKRVFVITPLDGQRDLAERVREHWLTGFGAKYNRYRREAFELICVVPSYEKAWDAVVETEGEAPLLIATDASPHDSRRSVSYHSARRLLEKRAVIVVFGTAWGLDREFLDMADHVLEPVYGRTGYNHLSVRTAAGIILDRLAGDYE